MEYLEIESVILLAVLAVAALVVPAAAIAVHQHRRRNLERAAGLRRKEKIRL